MKTLTKVLATTAAGLLIVGAAAGSGAVGTGSRSATASSSSSRPTAETTVSFRVGHRGDTFETGALWRLRLKPGLYHADFRATVFLQPADPNATEASVICGLINLENFGTENTRIFAADSSVQLANGVPAAVSGASTFYVGEQTRLGLVCFAQGSTIQLFQPILATFTPGTHRTFGVTRPIPLPTGKLRSLWDR
jgi:hypothetical protein